MLTPWSHFPLPPLDAEAFLCRGARALGPVHQAHPLQGEWVHRYILAAGSCRPAQRLLACRWLGAGPSPRPALRPVPLFPLPVIMSSRRGRRQGRVYVVITRMALLSRRALLLLDLLPHYLMVGRRRASGRIPHTLSKGAANRSWWADKSNHGPAWSAHMAVTLSDVLCAPIPWDRQSSPVLPGQGDNNSPQAKKKLDT